MSIASLSAASFVHHQPPAAQTAARQPSQVSKPDHDGDADDGGGSSKTSATSSRLLDALA